MKAYLLFPFAVIYRAAVFVWDLCWPWRRRVTLPARVISIGGLTAGGSGKTSMAAFVASRLRARRGNPAVVARGYKRSGKDDMVVSRTDKSDWEDCGDEPAVLVRLNPGLRVYVSDDKTRAAAAAARDGHDPIIVDDGFQHRRLKRDVDIVCLDGSNPFGNGMMLPSGRLREPLSALNRASVVVIIDPPEDGFESLDKIPADKELFTARKITAGVRSLDGSIKKIDKARCLAFCGIGNPRSFRDSLEVSSLDPLDFMEFPDHHRYSSGDIEEISGRFESCGAELIITTLKDAVRLEKIWKYTHPLYYLDIMIEMEHEEEFFGKIIT